MSDKWILIVDDEGSILSVLKNSLKKLGEDYHVMTAESGYEGLKQLEQREFDLVITDYKMAGMDGLQFLEKAHAIAPDIRVILMTAYGSLKVEQESTRLNVYRYLTKPLEIEAFRQIVKEAFEQSDSLPSGVLVLTEEEFKEINQILSNLRIEIGARCIFLTDCEGHYIARAGNTDNLPLARMATLLGSSIATLTEAGKDLGDDKDAVNLIFRESKPENLYVMNVGNQFLLILVMSHDSLNSRLGLVWYLSRPVVDVLREKTRAAHYTSPNILITDNLQGKFSTEMDQLFILDTPSSTWAQEIAPPDKKEDKLQ